MITGRNEGRPVGPRRLVRHLGGGRDPVFSICVMVTDWAEYDACVASFRARGFDEDHCEFLTLDNSAGNTADAYLGLNEFLQAAAGRYIILCHHDILLLRHDLETLLARLAELEGIDPDWAVCGNAGYSADGWPHFNLTSDAVHVVGGPFPVRVVAVDENFMVVRGEANIALSRDLTGFHHYGADLCIVADILGWNAYVIDFHLQHNSNGTVDERYFRSRDRITAKYRRALRPRWLHPVIMHPFLLAGAGWRHRLARLERLGGKLLGIYPRGKHLQDPKHQARRTARLARRGKR